jgi:hypothetical protein
VKKRSEYEAFEKLWNNKTGATFGTTVNSANIISLLLPLFLIIKVESGSIRRKGLKSRLLVQLLYFKRQASVAHRSPPCKFLGGFFGVAICKPQLILRRCGCGVGGVAGFALK